MKDTVEILCGCLTLGLVLFGMVAFELRSRRGTDLRFDRWPYGPKPPSGCNERKKESA